MNSTLRGDQWPKGLNEEEVRKIAREENLKFLGLLKDHFANTPQRADGNVNARDFFATLEIVEHEMMRTETPEPLPTDPARDEESPEENA